MYVHNKAILQANTTIKRRWRAFYLK